MTTHEHHPELKQELPAPATRTTGGVRRWIAGATAGLVLGALLVGGSTFAQEATPGTDDGQTFIERLAGKLGIGSDELETAIQETKTDMVDEAIASGELTEEQGNALKERIASGQPGFGFGFGRGFGGHHGGHGFMHHVALDTIAGMLGMTEDELRTELESGSSLSDVITAQGSTVDEVVNALVAEAESQLNEAVANGRITQEHADTILAELPERLTEMIENGVPGPGRFPCWGTPESDDSTQDDEATTTSVTVTDVRWD